MDVVFGAATRVQALQAKINGLKECGIADSDPKFRDAVYKGALSLSAHQDGKRTDGNVSKYSRDMGVVAVEAGFTSLEEISRCNDKNSDEYRRALAAAHAISITRPPQKVPPKTLAKNIMCGVHAVARALVKHAEWVQRTCSDF